MENCLDLNATGEIETRERGQSRPENCNRTRKKKQQHRASIVHETWQDIVSISNRNQTPKQKFEHEP